MVAVIVAAAGNGRSRGTIRDMKSATLWQQFHQLRQRIV